MTIQIRTMAELKKKIKACAELNISYELSGDIVPCVVDIDKEQYQIYCEEEASVKIYNVTPRHIDTISDNIIIELYNFDDKSPKFKNLVIDTVKNGKIKTEFFVTTTKYGEKYWKLADTTTLYLNIEGDV